jgi:hypothetical protein
VLAFALHMGCVAEKASKERNTKKVMCIKEEREKLVEEFMRELDNRERETKKLEQPPVRYAPVEKEAMFRRRKRKHLALVLNGNKGARLKWIGNKKDHFSFDKNYYFIVDSGIYITRNNVRVSIYLEGISTPLNHGNIEYEEIMKTIIDLETKEARDVKVNVIKGLKYDSKLLNTLLNSKLFERITKKHSDAFNIALLLLVIVTLAITIIHLGLEFT